jgi:hypothetical protein
VNVTFGYICEGASKIGIWILAGGLNKADGSPPCG